MNTTLFGEKIFANLRILRWDHPRLCNGPQIQWQVSLQEEKEGGLRHSDPQGGHTKLEAGTGGDAMTTEGVPGASRSWKRQGLQGCEFRTFWWFSSVVICYSGPRTQHTTQRVICSDVTCILSHGRNCLVEMWLPQGFFWGLYLQSKCISYNLVDSLKQWEHFF